MYLFLFVVFIIFVFIGVLAKIIEGIQSDDNNGYERGNRNFKKGFDPSNYETRQTMMNSSERVFFETLRRAIGDKFDIYPQVNLDKIFKTKYIGNKFDFRGARWAIDRRSVDYLLVVKETQSPKIAIELDGASHERQDRIERDEKVGSIFDYNGVPLVRFNVNDNFNETELRSKFERFF